MMNALQSILLVVSRGSQTGAATIRFCSGRGHTAGRAVAHPTGPGAVTSSATDQWPRRAAAAVIILGLALVLLLSAGCQAVQPWQRGAFADYTMRPDRDPLHTAMSEHIYFSREASSGGRGVGGSGCGCN